NECGWRWSAASGDHPDHYAVARGQRDVRDRQRRGDRRLELAVALGKAHRGARVDKNVGEQVLFFLEQLDVELVGAAVEAPIDVTEIVAVGIMAKVAELE